MRIELEPGKYVVAVSGGVDSMSLLHLIYTTYGQSKTYQFVVAHFNHGIRDDSNEDQQMIDKIARTYELVYSSGNGQLEVNSSEEEARVARYEFLNKTRKEHKADAIITAHHLDDQLETAVINMLRGTEFRGLCSLGSTKTLIRPLLSYKKAEFIDYAKANNLTWREDSTNTNQKYLRNYLRANIMPKINLAKLKEYIDRSDEIAREIDLLLELTTLTPNKTGYLRYELSILPYAISKEILRKILIEHAAKNITTQLIERLTVAIKAGKPDKQYDIDNKLVLILDKKSWKIADRYSNSTPHV